MKTEPSCITLALSGASGMPYGLRLLEQLVRADKQIYLLVSQAAHAVLAYETTLALPSQTSKMQAFLVDHTQAQPDQIRVFSSTEWTAPIASGSGAADAMVVCPCSMGCVSAIATGASNNLLERAADVMIKERRPLILVARETPLSVIHLRNLLQLAEAGVTLLPANPGFYHQPKSIDDLVNFIVARVLEQLGIDQQLISRWGV